MLSHEDLHKYEHLVREADARGINSFVDDKVFQVTPRPHADNTMSCLWFRKWKGQDINSRLVVRGFLNPQKKMVARYSSTATRLSQRLLCSLAVEH